MFKVTYKHMYDQITPNEYLVSAVIASKRVSRKSRTVMPLLRKPAIASIALVLCVIISIPALAASIPAFYEVLYSISPATAQFFKAVQKSCVDNGIKMEVISAYVHGDTAEIYIALKDLTENRLDATTDLFDSYSIHRPFDSSATCYLVNFDEESRTAMFLISITAWGNKDITGDKITFSVRKLLSNKHIYDDLPVSLNLENLSVSINTMPMPQNGGGGNYRSYFGDNDYIPDVLIPQTPIDFGVSGIDISGVGYADGKLHIQTVVKNSLSYDNHGYFYFKDSNGDKVLSVYGVAFIMYENGERLDYTEHVFDVSQSELEQYKMYGYFVTSGNLIDGYWNVTFRLE